MHKNLYAYGEKEKMHQNAYHGCFWMIVLWTQLFLLIYVLKIFYVSMHQFNSHLSLFSSLILGNIDWSLSHNEGIHDQPQKICELLSKIFQILLVYISTTKARQNKNTDSGNQTWDFFSNPLFNVLGLIYLWRKLKIGEK